MHKNFAYTLYLGSTSRSRQMLLREAGIPFTIINQSADESKCDWNLPLQEAVKHIARYKMEHVLLPHGHEGDYCFVLTADTLTENQQGTLEGKPVDRDDAITKLISARQGVTTGTAFVLERRIYRQGNWSVQEQVIGYAQASYVFNVPDAWIDYYFAHVPALGCSGAIAIEGLGNQFLQTLNGSLTAVIGLPMYELRQALEAIGFFQLIPNS